MSASAQPASRPNMFDVFLVAGEESGDRLGAALMRALRARTGSRVRNDLVGFPGNRLSVTFGSSSNSPVGSTR